MLRVLHQSDHQSRSHSESPQVLHRRMRMLLWVHSWGPSCHPSSSCQLACDYPNRDHYRHHSSSLQVLLLLLSYTEDDHPSSCHAFSQDVPCAQQFLSQDLNHEYLLSCDRQLCKEVYHLYLSYLPYSFGMLSCYLSCQRW